MPDRTPSLANRLRHAVFHIQRKLTVPNHSARRDDVSGRRTTFKQLGIPGEGDVDDAPGAAVFVKAIIEQHPDGDLGAANF